MRLINSFEINRKIKIGKYSFGEVFECVENCKTLWRVFGSKTKLKNILKKTRVKISKKSWIIWVDDKDGSININKNYFAKTPKKILYLDVIHEMVHVKQFLEGKNLFDKRFKYVDMPTEIEAYKYTVLAAKELNMGKRAIENYLKINWITHEEHKRLVSSVLG